MPYTPKPSHLRNVGGVDQPKTPSKKHPKERVKQVPDNFNPGSLIPWYVDQDSSRLTTVGVPLQSIWITYASPTASTIAIDVEYLMHALDTVSFTIYGYVTSSQNHSKK